MVMNMRHKQELNEEGMVAIMIAMFLMIILSLITLGFMRLMQREQRQALDNNLSTQAYYAAESGINDAIKAARTNPAYAKASCGPDATLSTNTISATLLASYPCVLVDQSPSSLEYNNGSIKTDRSTVVPLQAPAGVTFNKVQIAWSSTSTSPTFTDCSTTKLPTAGSWGANTGIMRIDLIPADGALSRNSLIDNAINLYLFPCTNTSGTTNAILYTNHIGPSKQGQIVAVKCTLGASPRDCILDVDFSNLPVGAFSQQNQYYLRMKGIYVSSNVTITGLDATGKKINLSGAQVKIDSTGKVNDVVRRLQVRVPIKQFPIPEYVVQSMDGICKKLEVTTVSVTGFVPFASGAPGVGQCGE